MRDKIVLLILTFYICNFYFIKAQDLDYTLSLSFSFVERDTNTVYFDLYKKYLKLDEEGRKKKPYLPKVYPAIVDSCTYKFLEEYSNLKIDERIERDSIYWIEGKESEMRDFDFSLYPFQELSSLFCLVFNYYPMFGGSFSGFELKDTTAYIDFTEKIRVLNCKNNCNNENNLIYIYKDFTDLDIIKIYPKLNLIQRINFVFYLLNLNQKWIGRDKLIPILIQDINVLLSEK